MHLENDCFTITYDAKQVSVAAVLEKIRGLGYTPEEIIAAKPADNPQTDTAKPLPELIDSALTVAVEESKLLLIDFYAGWCTPCKVLETQVLTDADVKHALENYHLVKVDTDRYPEVAEYFKIRALPTLIIMDHKSIRRFRHLGLIDAEDLVRELTRTSRHHDR